MDQYDITWGYTHVLYPDRTYLVLFYIYRDLGDFLFLDDCPFLDTCSFEHKLFGIHLVVGDIHMSVRLAFGSDFGSIGCVFNTWASEIKTKAILLFFWNIF